MVSSGVVKVACVVVMCMVAAAPLSVEAITCSQVVSSLNPCLSYLQRGGAVPPGCCSGVKSVNSAAKTTADRQATCKCLKNIAGSTSGINLNLASGLPGKCGASVPYKIRPSTDCSKLT